MTQPFISFCAIVKNEKQHLPRCLSSVRPYVDEMIVVDTGSEDGTPEIARQQGAKVFQLKFFSFRGAIILLLLAIMPFLKHQESGF